MICRHIRKLRKAFAKPGGNFPLHVDSERLKPFLQATDSKEAQTAHILPKIQSPYLGHSKTANRYKTCEGIWTKTD